MNSAQLTQDKDAFGQMDPYVHVVCGKEDYKTQVAVSQGLTPHWNEVFTFKIDGKEPDVKFKLYDKDTDKDDYIASGSFALKDQTQHNDSPHVIELFFHSGFKKISKGL